jgi:hypothetical protein
MEHVDSDMGGDECCVWRVVREETNGALGKWYEGRRMVRLDIGTRGDERCVWTVVRDETNGVCGQW